VPAISRNIGVPIYNGARDAMADDSSIGANIPGKKSENMIYVGGINMYEKEIRSKMEGWQGFEVLPAAATAGA
jgi:hypothetical protein